MFIFNYNDIQEIPLKILKGDQMGAYYGSSLLVTQQYLLVGAPMYNMKAYEEGCVFIYRNDRVNSRKFENSKIFYIYFFFISRTTYFFGKRFAANRKAVDSVRL